MRKMLFAATILLLVAGAVSAHGFGMPGYGSGIYGYGMPMMGWYQGGPYPDENTQKTEFIGNITAVYPMFVVLDNGKSVYLPWWIYNLKPGDVISGEGVEYGWIIPESLEVNGEAIDLPVNQQAPNYPAGYPAGYGMPMMGYGMPMGMMGYGMGYCH
jgi:hypothetical protein